MKEGPKREYSLEDNVKYISFGIKDLTKAIQELNIRLEEIRDAIFSSRGERDNEVPF